VSLGAAYRTTSLKALSLSQTWDMRSAKSDKISVWLSVADSAM
jgi:hypothetical protein